MEKKKFLKSGESTSALKNDAVLKNFDKLIFGDHLTILYDHEPVSLYYDLLNFRNGLFEWEYLEAGPEVWMVKIKNIRPDYRTVAEIILEHPKASRVFSYFNIDYCCKGNMLLNDACKEAGVEASEVLQKIEKVSAYPELNEKAELWPLGFLIDYIQVVHHSFVKEKKKTILSLLLKVQKLHEESHPELFVISKSFKKISEALRMHMQKEEILVFPAIKSLENTDDPTFHYTIRSLEDIVRAMKIEHNEIGGEMAVIRRVSDNYTIPKDACNSFEQLYNLLEEFENDLHLHVHLENNILFPKAIEIRNEFL